MPIAVMIESPLGVTNAEAIAATPGVDVLFVGINDLAAEMGAGDIEDPKVVQAVRRTFVTPFDRGDIKALITSMDDAVDEMKKTAKTILLFEVTSFESNMVAMAEAIVQCAKLVARAMPLLSDIGRNAGQLTEICLQITQIEGRGDDLDRKSVV